MPIQFISEHPQFLLQRKTALRLWIKKTTNKYKKNLRAVNYVFCTDAFLLTLNQQYLKHNTYTDIVTFDYGDTKNITGEIYISIDRVKENAITFKTTFENELHRVMIHGVLHLCGLKDKSAKDKKIMRMAENDALKQLK